MMKKSRKKIEKLFFGSEFSEAKNETTFRLTKNREKKIEKLFLGQNYLKRIMS